ncbi:hypothetical protein [Caldithrix abyssi]
MEVKEKVTKQKRAQNNDFKFNGAEYAAFCKPFNHHSNKATQK